MGRLHEELHSRRLKWFINLRWAAVAGGIAILIGGPYVASLRIAYGKLTFCLVLLGLLNAVYNWYWEKVKNEDILEPAFSRKTKIFLHFQMSVDLGLLTALLYFSGGVGNPLFLLYLFHLAISAIVFSAGESFFYALLALVLPWILFGFGKLGALNEDLWAGQSSFTQAHEIALLWAYSVTVGGLWFFLSRLSLDVASKERNIRETGEKLKGANEALRQLDVFKNQFLKQVVFQLKSPAIEMDFDLSKVESALPANSEKALEAVRTAKKRIWILLELIEDLTWLSRAESGEAPLKKQWINVYETLLHRIQWVESLAAQKGIHFQLHGDAQTRLMADQEAFEKVVENLFSNAVKYTLPGETYVKVDFRTEIDWMVLSVEDEGIGIPSKQQKRLFHEFFRASNAKTIEKFGTGLGLSIVKQVMDKHGGRVVLSSESKKGTKIETWWPFLLESQRGG